MNFQIFVGTSKIVAGPSLGKNCHFPFEYKNKKHYQCITEDSLSQRPWCSSNATYSDYNFGYCGCAIKGKSKILA